MYEVLSVADGAEGECERVPAVKPFWKMVNYLPDVSRRGSEFLGRVCDIEKLLAVCSRHTARIVKERVGGHVLVCV